MKRLIWTTLFFLISVTASFGQLTVVEHAVTFAGDSTTTLNGAVADTSDVIDWSTTYYQAVQWRVSGTTPRVKIELQTAMQNLEAAFKTVKTIEDSTQNTNWSDPTSLQVAGSKFRRYIVMGLSTNGADTVFRMREFLLNLPLRR